MTGLIMALVLIYCSGAGLVRLVDRRGIYADPREHFSLSMLAGIGAVAFVQLYAVCLQLFLSRITIILYLSPLLVVGVRDTLPRLRRAYAAGYAPVRSWYAGLGGFEKSCMFFLAGLSIFTAVVCCILPLAMWDAISNWGFKARIIFDQQTLFVPDFFDEYRCMPWKSYPYLLPLAESFIYNILGAADEHRMKILFAVFYAGLLVQMYVMMRSCLGMPRRHACAGTAAFASLPSFIFTINGAAATALADVPLAVFYTLNVVYLYRYIKDRVFTHLIIAAFFAACALFTKNEGMALCGLSAGMLLADAVTAPHGLRRAIFRDLFRYAGITAVLILPWFIVREGFPKAYTVGNDPLKFLWGSAGSQQTYSLGLVLQLSFRQMFADFRSWGLFWYFVAAALILPRDTASSGADRRREWYLFIIPFMYYFFILTPLYMFYPTLHYNALETKFSGMSFERLRFHVLPLVWLFVSVRISRFLAARHPQGGHV